MSGIPLTPWQGAHEGKPAAIIAAGPSVRHVRPEHLAGYVTITVNSGFLAYPDCDYYFSCDGTNALHRHWYELQHHRCRAFLHGLGGWTPETLPAANVSPERVFWYGRREHQRQDYRMRQSDTRTIVGTSSAHPAVNLAVIFGCSPIVLLGCDCCWEGGRLHAYDFDDVGDPVVSDLFPHSTDKQVPPNEPAGMDNMQSVMVAVWRRMAAANPDIEILNASGGRLDAFPRIRIEELPKYAQAGQGQRHG